MKLNKVETEALSVLIAYMVEDEQKHYAESGYPKGHIYLEIVKLWRAVVKATGGKLPARITEKVIAAYAANGKIN